MITFATLKFESFQCCVHLTWLITQTQIIHIFHFPYMRLGSLLYTMELRQFRKTLHSYIHSQPIEHWHTLATFRSTAWSTTLTKYPFFVSLLPHVTSRSRNFPTATFKCTNTTTFMNKVYKDTQITSTLFTQINLTVNEQNKWNKHKWINEWLVHI